MKIIKYSEEKREQIIQRAVRVMKAGGVVVYPTETSYGLGGDAKNKKAIRKIYAIKGRDFRKPLSVLVGNISQARKLVFFSIKSLNLVNENWPGPLTLVTRFKTGKFLKELVAGGDTIGIRISSHLLAQELVKTLGRPIIATSANVSGQGDIYNINELIQQLASRKFKPDLVIDYGELPKVKPSTIVELNGNKWKILRMGSINPKS